MTAIALPNNLVERFFLLFGATLFSIFFLMYITEFDLRTLLFGADPFAGKEKIGILGTKTGEFRRKLLVSPAFKVIAAKSDLFNHDTVVTGEDSVATLELYDGSVLELGPNTMIKLSFESGFAFGGLGRRTTVNIISGKVKAQSRTNSKNIVIKHRKKTKRILTKPNVADIIVVPEVTPIDVQEAKVPDLSLREGKLALPPPIAIDPVDITESVQQVVETTPSIKPSSLILEQKQIIELFQTSPRRNARLSVPKNAKVAQVPVTFRWRSSIAKTPIVLTVRRKISQEEFKAKMGDQTESEETAKISEYEDVFSKAIPSTGTRYFKRVIVKKPGDYEWEISPEDSKIGLKDKKIIVRSFRIPKKVRDLKIDDPLISGQKMSNNRYMGKIIKNFDINLKWESIPNPDRYRLRFFRQKAGKKPLLERTLSKNTYDLNRNRVPKRIVYMEVTAFDKNGFYYKSPRRGFRFDFSPPLLKNPPNQSEVFWEELLVEGIPYEIFTWERTNFTLKYEIEVARDADFKDVFVKKSIKDNFLNVKLQKRGRYFWRVKSIGHNFTSVPSPTQQFELK